MKKMRWYDYITVNIFWLGLNIRNISVQNYIMPYMVNLFVPEAIKNTALGGMRAAGLVIAMLVQPATGLLSDRSTSRFGRRRPYILIGALGDLLFLAAIALSWNYVSLLLAILLIQFTSNISHGPLQGLIPDLVPEDQRGKASAVKSVMELIPVILVGLTIAQMIGPGPFMFVITFNRMELFHFTFSNGLKAAIFLTGVALFVVLMVTLFFVKEEPLVGKPDTPFWPSMLRVLGMLAGIVVGALAGLIGGLLLGGLAGLASLPFTHEALAWSVDGRLTTFAALTVGVGGGVAMVMAVIVGVWAGTLATLGQDARRNASFTWWVVNRLMFLAAVTSIQGSVLYFVMYAFKLSGEGATGLTGTLNTVIGAFIVVTALASGWIADRIGRRLLVSLSGITAAVGGFLLLGTIWLPNLGVIYTAGIVIGLGTGLFMTANWALGTDLVPPGEAGRYLGVSNLAGAGAGIVGAGIGGIVADQLNLVRPGLGYFAIFASYAVLFALSSVSLLGVHESKK